MVTKSVKNGSLDVVCDLWRSAGDESGVVLEQIAGNRPDTILLLWKGTEDIDKISDVLWCTRKVVKFLSFRFGEISWVLEGGWDGRIERVTYDGNLSLDNSVVVGGVAYRLENFLQSSFGGSPGGHGCLERVKGTEEKRYAFELSTRFSVHCTRTTIWLCLRRGTGHPRQQENSTETQRN